MDKTDNIKVTSLNADVTIIGAGGCGLAAALTAAEKGAQVVVLEKMGSPGGNSVLAFGIFAIDSPAQKRLEIDVSKDSAFILAMDWAHWKIDPLIERAFIDKSGDTIAWLESKGLYFDKVPLVYNYFKERTYHVVGPGKDDREVPNTGREAIRVFRKSCQELGVPILTGHRAKKYS